MNNVFISYSRRDKEFVQKLVAAFKDKGRDVWIDWEDIPLTADWMQEIHEGIEGADDFIFIISPDSVVSEVASQELAHAIKHNKRLVPVLWREVSDYKLIHPIVASHNWIMFNQPEMFETAFEGLLNTLDTDLEYTRAHTRLLQRAIEWDKNKRPASSLLRGQDLAEAERWLGSAQNKSPHITPLQTDYIIASRRRSIAYQRRLIALLGIGFVTSILLSLVAIASRNEAQAASILARDAQFNAETQAAIATIARGKAEESARIADENAAKLQSLLLADNARQVRDQNPGLALILALEANRMPDSPSQSQQTLSEIAYAPGIKRIFTGFKGVVTSVSFNNHQPMVAASSYDGSTVIWDLNTAKPTFKSNEFAIPVRSMAFSPDGNLIASGLLDGTVIVWDVTSQNVKYRLGGLRTRTGHSSTVNALAYVVAADQQWLVSGGSDDLIVIWDLTTGEIVKTFDSTAGDVNTISIDQINQRLYIGTASRRVKVYNLKNLDADPVQYNIHGGAILSLDVANNSRSETLLALSSANNGEVVVWNANTGEVIRRLGDAFGDFQLSNTVTNAVGFTPDGNSAVLGTQDGRLLVFDARSGRGVMVLRTAGLPILALTVSQDGRSILTGTGEAPLTDVTQGDTKPRMMLWDIENGAVLGYLEGHNDAINDVAYSPDGQQIATVSDDWDALIWNTADTSIAFRLAGHQDDINALAYSPDGALLVTGGEDSQIIVWSMQTGHALKTASTGEGRVNALAFLPNDPENQQIVIALDDSRVVVMNWMTPRVVHEFRGHSRRVLSMAVGPDGRYAASGSAGGDLLLWEMNATTPLLDLKENQEGDSNITALVFSPDSQTLLSGSDRGEIILWDVATRTLLRRFEGGGSGLVINTLQFSPNGEYVVSGSNDSRVNLWAVSSGQTIRQFGNIHQAAVMGVTFHPEGEKVVSVSRDGLGVIWQMPTLRGLVSWARGNRFVPELSCTQKLFYRLVSSCPSVNRSIVQQSRNQNTPTGTPLASMPTP